MPDPTSLLEGRSVRIVWSWFMRAWIILHCLLGLLTFGWVEDGLFTNPGVDEFIGNCTNRSGNGFMGFSFMLFISAVFGSIGSLWHKGYRFILVIAFIAPFLAVIGGRWYYEQIYSSCWMQGDDLPIRDANQPGR